MNCNILEVASTARHDMKIPMKRFWLAATAVFLAYCGCFDAKELRVAAWNLEHLNENGEEGCITRTQADYDNIAATVNKMQFDVVAIQEVKDEAAARRVFSSDEWEIELSKRPPMKDLRECWGLPGRYLRHLGTGFAIRKGISYRRNPDFEVLGLDDDFQRWGTDITLLEGAEVRLLSVHLRSGCWGAEQDEDDERNETCQTLRQQIEKLSEWRDERLSEKVPFLILGDFNRRLAVTDDWAWSILTSTESSLHLVTASVETQCDPRFDELIDHIVADSSAAKLVVENSTSEGPRIGEHPDHCAVSTIIQL